MKEVNTHEAKTSFRAPPPRGRRRRNNDCEPRGSGGRLVPVPPKKAQRVLGIFRGQLSVPRILTRVAEPCSSYSKAERKSAPGKPRRTHEVSARHERLSLEPCGREQTQSEGQRPSDLSFCGVVSLGSQLLEIAIKFALGSLPLPKAPSEFIPRARVPGPYVRSTSPMNTPCVRANCLRIIVTPLTGCSLPSPSQNK